MRTEKLLDQKNISTKLRLVPYVIHSSLLHLNSSKPLLITLFSTFRPISKSEFKNHIKYNNIFIYF